MRDDIEILIKHLGYSERRTEMYRERINLLKEDIRQELKRQENYLKEIERIKEKN